MAYFNIMMEADDMYPKGFHPMGHELSPDFRRPSQPKRRNQSKIKYYFTDFGISRQFESYEKREKVVGFLAQDRTVPELSMMRPYDPFAVDIYTLGNVYNETLLHVRIVQSSVASRRRH